MKQLLDNVMWHSLKGPHAPYSAGSDTARRYAIGFSPLIGFADPARPDFAGLAGHCSAGEHFYCAGWSGAAPDDWQVEVESTMFKMVWEAGLPEADAAAGAQRLGHEHVQQALELAALTKPGPFGPRTIELGEYFGYFDGPDLVAMAGERMHAGQLREVSGVCTHPKFQGHGLARRLMLKLIRRQLQRGETPFLHVMRDNHAARQLYERMGFRNYQECIVRVVAPR